MLGPGDAACIEMPTFADTGGREACRRDASWDDATVRLSATRTIPRELSFPAQKSSVSMRAEWGCLFLDEAFIELADPRQSLVDYHTRTLRAVIPTKESCRPRIHGYGFGSPELVDIERARLLTVNMFAESFAIEAFRHYDRLEEQGSGLQKNGPGFPGG